VFPDQDGFDTRCNQDEFDHLCGSKAAQARSPNNTSDCHSMHEQAGIPRLHHWRSLAKSVPVKLSRSAYRRIFLDVSAPRMREPVGDQQSAELQRFPVVEANGHVSGG
jgi:hypothetical protein